MLFNSYEFILAFLPITWVVYFLACRVRKERLGVFILAASSILFVAVSSIQSAAILLLSVAANYWLGHQISQKRGKASKVWLIAGLVVDIGILGYFKYVNFLVDGVNGLFGADIPLVSAFLPVGLSFYTFQQIAYLADIYHGESELCGFGEYLLYVAFSPNWFRGRLHSKRN